MNTNDFALWEACRDDIEGMAVVAIVEGWDEYQVVGDVEVGVTGRKALAFKDHRSGHGELHDLEGIALEIAGGAKTVEVFGER